MIKTMIRIKFLNMRLDLVSLKSDRKQSESESSILFNLVLEKAIREMRIEPREGIKLRDKVISVLAYSDDVVLMEESQDRVKQFFKRLNNAAQKIVLHVNKQKTEYIIVGKRVYMDYVLMEIDQLRFKKIDHFKKLGTIIGEKNYITKQVAARIQKRNKV